MSIQEESPLVLKDHRFARLEAIKWWDQSLVRQARIMVVGAGALGNEIVKNLALLGVGHIVVVDMDRIESSNLCRSVLFREGDEGQFKAAVAARSAKEIYPDADVEAIMGNVMADVGLGYFRRSDAVLGAVDNREARVFVNAACARVGRPWIDGGIEVLQGIVRGFAPPSTACYECTMSEADWDLLNQRRSCSLLAQRAIAQQGTPTTPIAASVIGAIQVAEAIKLLHGMEALMGRGFVFEGENHTSYPVTYSVNPECRWHESPYPIEVMSDVTSDTPLRTIWNRASELLGGVDALEPAREIVESTTCPKCGQSQRVLKPAEKVHRAQIVCPRCDVECAPTYFHSITGDSYLLDLSPRQAGLPEWDILWARCGEKCIGVEVAGDQSRRTAPELNPEQARTNA